MKRAWSGHSSRAWRALQQGNSARSPRLSVLPPLSFASMSVRVAELVAALHSTEVKIVSAAAEALYKGVQTEGFNRLQNAQGQE